MWEKAALFVGAGEAEDALGAEDVGAALAHEVLQPVGPSSEPGFGVYILHALCRGWMCGQPRLDVQYLYWASQADQACHSPAMFGYAGCDRMPNDVENLQ